MAPALRCIGSQCGGSAVEDEMDVIFGRPPAAAPGRGAHGAAGPAGRGRTAGLLPAGGLSGGQPHGLQVQARRPAVGGMLQGRQRAARQRQERHRRPAQPAAAAACSWGGQSERCQ